MNSRLLFLAVLFCGSFAVGCNSTIPSDIASDQNSIEEDTLKLGSKIDSLHQWIINKAIPGFDYKTKMLAYNSIQNIKAFKLQPENDRFRLRDRIPSCNQFFSVEVVGYFFTDQKYYILMNCWDNQALHPKGFLISVTPAFETSAIPVYESTLDVTLDYSILKYALYDEKSNKLIYFDENPDVIYDDSYKGPVRYKTCQTIQKLVPNLSDEESRLCNGFDFIVRVTCDDIPIGQFSDTAWLKVDRIKSTYCFPETYEDFVFLSSRNWYYSYVIGNQQNRKSILSPCDKQ